MIKQGEADGGEKIKSSDEEKSWVEGEKKKSDEKTLQ